MATMKKKVIAKVLTISANKNNQNYQTLFLYLLTDKIINVDK